MRQQDLELGKIHGHVIQINGIAKFISRCGKYRRASVDHHRNPVRLCRSIDDFQLLHAVHVVIGIEHLVRWMDLDQPYAKPYQIVHLGLHVQRVPRMYAAA